MTIKLNIIGQVLGTSGYTSHTRQLASALNKICDVHLISQIVPGAEKELSDEELLMLKKADSPDRINVIIGFPHTWKQFCDRENNIGFLIWEGDRIPKSWLNDIIDPNIKQVWVPSKHTYNAISKSVMEEQYGEITMEKVKIVPHGVDLGLFHPAQKQDQPFTFLCNKGFRNLEDRGGVQYAIKAFDEEFAPGEARLMIKLNLAYSVSIQQLQELMGKIGIKQRQDIIVISQSVPYEKMNELYAQAHILLNPTRSEAFSIPSIEAMAAGVPVITTNYGGQVDFVTPDNGWLVDYQLTEVKHEVMYEGVQWATPSITGLRQAMRNAFEDRDKLKRKSERAIQDAKDWTWKHSADKALSFLKEVSA